MSTADKEDGKTTDMDSVMRRLKKLLALATDPAAAPGEAENAMRMAQNLMKKHKVSNAEMASSEIGEHMTQSTKATTPPPYESALLWELCRGFGAKHYWTPGRGPKGMRDKGYWYIVAEKSNLELIKYAYEVVMRQLTSSRSKYVAGLPEYWTRPRKAADGDAFGMAFVSALSKKIVDFTGQDPLIATAIATRVQDVTQGRVAKRVEIKWSSEAIIKGKEAGEKASLHRSVGAGPKPKKVEKTRTTPAYDREGAGDLYRVWPDGTTQLAEEAAYGHMSDDYVLIMAVSEDDARSTVAAL